MKRAFGFLLLLSAIPLCAQDVPILERAAIVATRGEAPWPVAIRSQAVGWSFDRPHQHVTISVHLGNGGGHAYIDAYLMKRVGPGATTNDEVAFTTFDLGYPFDDWVDVFTDLDLDAGRYWLVLARPKDVAHSSINWFVVQMREPAGSCSAQYTGSQAYTFGLDEAEYIPASKFEKKFEPYAFQFQVTQVRPAGADPCP